ncbi:MAG: hypothetical protein QOE30_957 [Mycobacterium sp.]|jgi:hypothetical protein|nr:hypothetical protein [Mycobacterium sp.]
MACSPQAAAVIRIRRQGNPAELHRGDRGDGGDGESSHRTAAPACPARAIKATTA